MIAAYIISINDTHCHTYPRSYTYPRTGRRAKMKLPRKAALLPHKESQRKIIFANDANERRLHKEMIHRMTR